MAPKKKKITNKIEELEKTLNEAEIKADNYLKQLKYAKADLENLRKQSQRHIAHIIDRANGQLLEQLLPILDEIGLILNSGSTEAQTIQGIGMVYKKLIKILESEGCKPIKAEGTPFDPFKHEAVLEIESEKQPDGFVLEEIRKGYTYKDRVLRPSMVKVARTPKKKEDKKDE
jgi:molecular chaperone GrpE